eukprot:gene1428-1553_t
MENDHDKSFGKSRAALKKRKKQAKELAKSGENTGGNDESNSNTDFLPPNKQRKLQIFQRPRFDHPLLNDIEDQSVLDLLQLKDPEEATSYEKASLLLSKLVFPLHLNTFFTSHWEKQPFFASHYEEHIEKEKKGKLPVNANYLMGKFPGRKALRTLISSHLFRLGEDIQIEGVSLSEDEVHGNEIWTKYSDIHPMTLLQPQIHDDLLWQFCGALEFEFNSRVDCHVLLLPKHYDEETEPIIIEGDRFLIQMEGCSQWKVTTNGVTCPYPLQCGDVLYVPSSASILRGSGDEKMQSLVMILIINKRHNRLADLLSLVLPQAVAAAAQEVTENGHLARLGKALPSNTQQKLGIAASELDEDEVRVAVLKEVEKALANVTSLSMDMLDPAADQMTKNFIAERLPVFITSEEENRTSAGASDARIQPYTRLRMLRPGIATTVIEDGKVVLYHCMENSREMFGAPLNPLEFELDDGPCIEGLLKAYPEAVMVSDLEHPSEEVEDKLGVAEALFKEGFLVIDDELSNAPNDNNQEEDDSDDPF